MLYDAAAGIYLTKTRAYNPKTGRFLERDKLDESPKDGYTGFISGKDAIGTNLYAWCGNNPITRVDPSGQSWFDLIRAAARVVIAVVQVFTYVAYNAVRQYAPAAARAIQRAATRVTTAVQQVAAPVKVIFQPAAMKNSYQSPHNFDSNPTIREMTPQLPIREQELMARAHANTVAAGNGFLAAVGALFGAKASDTPIDYDYDKACGYGRELQIDTGYSVIVGVDFPSLYDPKADWVPLPVYCRRHDSFIKIGQ